MNVPPSRRSRAGKRVAILHNVDYEDGTPDTDPAWASRAEVCGVAASVAAALEGAGYDAQIVEIDGDLTALRGRLVDFDPDCAFNLCESLAGDARLESAIPLLLDLLGVPFTGSPAEVLSLALRKDRVKERLVAAGVPTPAGRVLRSASEPCDLTFPLIVKPVREDGSVGITRRSVVRDAAELAETVADVTRTFRQPALVEEFVDGRELNVGLFGDPTPRVLPLSEIDFSGLPAGMPSIVSYEAKWTATSPEFLGTVPQLHPALPPGVGARVRRVAVEAFRAVGVRDYGRVDIRLSTAGTPYVIDVNPNCDLSSTAGLARSAAAVGIDHPAMVGLLVRYALRRRRSGSVVPRAAARSSR
jgi:D-alanine-D-alanine ligase